MHRSLIALCAAVLTVCNLVVVWIAFTGIADTTAKVCLILAAVVSEVACLLVSLGGRSATGIKTTPNSAEESFANSTNHESQVNELQQQREAFEQLRATTLAGFQELSVRLEHRERDLAQRLAQYQEILNYPSESDFAVTEASESIRLAENDQRVNRLLESEAERVYEKIRKNEYWVDGTLDVASIRQELHDLIHKVARIYSPSSEHPLLETSFEQLARAASRICLHCLVLLEQLPLGVQKYNFKSLYGYFQKATAGYGAYKKAAPWLTYLTRGIYAGRLASASNPLTLGAWWLATEVGKKGAAKFVENVVDKQAVAVLHDLVTVIGVEVACIYGPGFRQRDPAWALGTELVEMLSRFPTSRESLKNALMQVTTLPLRNEYDRIYLYRCLAAHQPSGMRLPDPAMLSRTHREQIAAALESFISKHVHGVTPEVQNQWRTDFEDRFDLKLKLDRGEGFGGVEHQAALSLNAIGGFLFNCCGWTADQTRDHLRRCALFGMVSEDVRASISDQGPGWTPESQFHPPDIDPDSDLTDKFLAELARIAALCVGQTEMVEELVVETGAYFRKKPDHVRSLIDSQMSILLSKYSNGSQIDVNLGGQLTACVLKHRQHNEGIAFIYPDARVVRNHKLATNTEAMAPDSIAATVDVASGLQRIGIIVGYLTKGESMHRTLFLCPNAPVQCCWQASDHVTVTREKHVLVDHAVICGGLWLDASLTADEHQIVVPGSLLGGRFTTYFQPLLQRLATGNSW